MMTKESCSDSKLSVQEIKGRGNQKNYIIFVIHWAKMMNASIYYPALQLIAKQ